MAVRRVTISQEIGELRDCGILSVSGRWNLSAGRVRWKSVRFQLNMVSVEERRYDKIAGIISFSNKRHTVDGQMARIQVFSTFFLCTTHSL